LCVNYTFKSKLNFCSLETTEKTEKQPVRPPNPLISIKSAEDDSGKPTEKAVQKVPRTDIRQQPPGGGDQFYALTEKYAEELTRAIFAEEQRRFLLAKSTSHRPDEFPPVDALPPISAVDEEDQVLFKNIGRLF
jgi:hypothetical protein